MLSSTEQIAARGNRVDKPTGTLALATRPTRAAARGANLATAKNRLLANITSNWAGYLINAIVAFFITPLVVHSLGNAGYGVWALISQLVGYMGVLDFGVRNAICRFIAHHHALDEHDRIDQVLSTALAYFLIPSGLAVAGGAVIATYFDRWFNIPPDQLFAGRVAVILASLTVAGVFIAAVFNTTLAAISRYDYLNLSNTICCLARAALLWYFIGGENGSVIAVAAIHLGLQIVSIILGYALVRHQLPFLRIARRFFDLGTMVHMIRFSSVIFVLTMANYARAGVQTVIIGFFLGPVAVGYYAVGALVPDQLRAALGGLIMVYVPLATQMNALEKRESLRRLWVSGSRAALLLMLAGILGVIAFGREFLTLWMGIDYASRSGSVQSLLVIGITFSTVYMCAHQILYGMDRLRVNAWLSSLEAILTLVLSVVLVRYYGIVGVVVGALIPAVVFQALLVPAFTSRSLAIPIRTYFWQVWARTLLAAVPYAAWLWVCHLQGLVQGWISLAAVILAGLVIFAGSAWLIAIDPHERASIRDMISRIRPGFLGASH
jgi:O-antigen/teichoic acid export membrane protein